MKSMIVNVLTVMVLLFRYFGTPYVSGQLAEAEQKLVSPHKKVGIPVSENGGRPPHLRETAPGKSGWSRHRSVPPPRSSGHRARNAHGEDPNRGPPTGRSCRYFQP